MHLDKDISSLEFVLQIGISIRVLPCKKGPRVWPCDAMHCIKARALQTRVEACEERVGGTSSGYIEHTSCNKTAKIPKA